MTANKTHGKRVCVLAKDYAAARMVADTYGLGAEGYDWKFVFSPQTLLSNLPTALYIEPGAESRRDYDDIMKRCETLGFIASVTAPFEIIRVRGYGSG